MNDLRFALRILAKSPGFTAAAIAVLALGIGVNTAIFSMIHELVFSPRPWPAENQVVQIYTQDEKNPKRFRMFSYPVFKEIQQQSAAFTDIMAHYLTMVGVGEGETARRTFGALVSANYFSTLQVPLLRGRGFLPAEEKPGAAVPVMIVSYNYWQRLGFPADFVGRTLRINERPFTVVGIAPEGFSGTTMLFGPELYFPLGCYDLLSNDFASEAKRTFDRSDAYNLVLVGRLKPGQTMTSAAPGLKTLATQLREIFPQELKEQTFTSRPLPRLSTSNAPAQEGFLSIFGVTMLVMAAIVLLIASLNLANMLLARGHARRKEFAIRLAIGGSRGRIVRQLLTEGFVLALGGGLAGFVLGTWAIGFLMRTVGSMAPVGLFFKGATNPALFAATFGFCALATIFFALGPALKLSRADVLTDLKDSAGEDAVQPHRNRWMPRNPLVVAQLALSLGLLTSAGLFIRSALAAGRVDTGFKADDTILLEADASLGGYDKPRSMQFYNTASDRLAALPGVQSVSIASVVPFGMISLDRAVLRAGLKPAKDAKPATAAEGLAFDARWASVGADYFSTMGLPLLRGRAFTKAEAESAGSPAVAIIDEALAKRLWPEGDGLGQHLQFAERGAPIAPGNAGSGVGSSSTITGNPSDPQSVEVVGIVPNTRWNLFVDNQGGTIFVPFAQGFQANVFFHVRTAARAPGTEAAVIDTMRREFRTAAPGVPLLTTKTFRQHLDSSMEVWIVRIGATMFSIFGSLALVLAAIGLYGVKAYSVARRTREIGIRLALGAAPGAVQSMILREGVAMIVTGVSLGLLLGLGLGQLLTTMLYQVSPVDPITFIFAPVVLSVVALLACYFPARRATRVDPLTALRTE